MSLEYEPRATSWVLAVDFGTSSTAVAIGRDGGAQLVGVDGGLPRMLSNVFLQESTGRLLLGDVADNASATAPWCFERSPKVKLGQQYMLLGDRRVRVADAVGAVLGRVAEDAIRLRGGERPGLVRLTHPVRWGEEKRSALVEAAATAGLDSPELVLEPVAAAMHYASERLRPGQHVAVYDLGGGTLDMAVLQRTESGFEVVGVPSGRDGFGGEEFDHRLYRFLGAQLPEEDWLRLRGAPEMGGDNAWPKANRQFQRNVRRAKELLTNNPQVDVDVPPPVNRELVLTVEDLNSLIRVDVENSVRELEQTIRSAGLEPHQLAGIYLAGGSSQIPLVGQLIHEHLGVRPEHLNDPKAVICLGAALRNGSASGSAPRPSLTEMARPSGLTEVASATGLTEVESSTGRTEVGSSTGLTEVGSSTGATEVAAASGLTEVATSAASTQAPPSSGVTQAPASGATDSVKQTGATELATRAGATEAVSPAGAQQTRRVPITPATQRTKATDARTSSAAVADAGQATPPRGRPVVAPPASAPKGRRRTPLLIGGLVAAIAIAVVAVLATSGGGSSPKPKARPAAANTKSSGPLTIPYAAPWRAASASVAGGFALGGTLTGAKATAADQPIQLNLPSSQMTLAAGVLKDSAPIPGGAPPQLVARYGHPITTSTAKVAGGTAKEYTWAQGNDRLLAYVIPTADADLGIVCSAPFAGGANFSTCTNLARKAKVSGVAVIAPGPVHAFADAVNKSLAQPLAIRNGLHGLKGKFSARATEANRLSAAELKAAKAVAGTSTPRRYAKAIAALVAALRGEANQFTALGKAAHASNRSSYSRAVGAVDSASRRLQAATKALAPYDLGIRSFGALALAGPPPAPQAPAPSSSGSSPAPSTPTPAPTTPAPAPTPTTPTPTATTPAPPPPPPPSTCTSNCTTPGI